MPSRSRADAYAAVLKASGHFTSDGVRLISTQELKEKLKQKEAVVLVDVRTPEEQKVSIIPGAVTREVFEAETLPTLIGTDKSGQSDVKVEPDTPEASSVLVVPYCTVGYRSGLYCRELMTKYSLNNVVNGEGIIMWAFDVGVLVRPLEGSGRALCHDEVVGKATSAADVEETDPSACVREFHVYAQPWDFAPDGFTTVRFSMPGAAWQHLQSKFKSSRSAQCALWVWALMLWYLLFTPSCGVMYKCGCQMALTKWSQVKPCNVFEEGAPHKCPWCACTGLPCLLVGNDRKVLRDVPILDTLPDGFFITVLTIVVLHLLWRRIDRFQCASANNKANVAIKASVAFAWFIGYVLLMGVLFFLLSPDYPFFFSELRAVKKPAPSLVPAPVPQGASYQYNLGAIAFAGTDQNYLNETATQAVCSSSLACLGYWKHTDGSYNSLKGGVVTYASGSPGPTVMWVKLKRLGLFQAPHPSPAPRPAPAPQHAGSGR